MIELNNVSLKFNNLDILENISFSISSNEIVAILGPSGCGKSTLLRIIAGLEQAYDGQILSSNTNTAFAFQDDRLLPWMDVWNNIKIVENFEDQMKISTLINDVGLNGFESYKPSQLSGGMKKRLGIARTFYYESDFILMDEPFSGLDYYMRQDMLEMITKLQSKSKQSILFVTHEVDDAIKIADRILVLSSRPASIIKEYKLLSKNQPSKNPNLDIKLKEDIMSMIMT